MKKMYKSVLLTEGASEIGNCLSKIAVGGWELHTLLEWADETLAIFVWESPGLPPREKK